MIDLEQLQADETFIKIVQALQEEAMRFQQRLAETGVIDMQAIQDF